MAPESRIHDRVLLDALEALNPAPFVGEVWRVVRSGRDPMRGSVANGRWAASGEFEVVYTSCAREGALAELGYRLGLEPIWPSLLTHDIHSLAVSLDRVLDLTDFSVLSELGVSEAKFEAHDYAAEQAISAAARFLGLQALLVPNARSTCDNLVVFPDQDDALAGISLNTSSQVDWNAWRASNRARPSRARGMK